MKTICKVVCILSLFLGSLTAGANSVLNGISIHTELGQESFLGALFTTTLSTNSRDILLAQEEKQLQVRILAKRISARRFKRMWIDGLAINASPSELQAQSQNMADFSNMLKVSLRAGDIFSVQRDLESVRIVINGSTLGVIEDPAFFDLLLRTWIGPVPLSSQFRDNLLLGGDFQPDIKDRFNNTRPSQQRIEAVASALAQAEAEKTEAQQEDEEAKRELVASSNVPNIKPPTIAAPPVVAPVPKPSAPKVSTPRPEEQAPVVAEVKPTPTPSPVKVEPKPEPVKKSPPKKVASAPKPDDESILEDDGEEFTAESLLSQQLYIAKLKQWTYKELVYPNTSLQKNEEGTVRLSVTINRNGKLTDSTVVEKPEFFRLTKAAIRAVRRSSPYPPVPDSIEGEAFTFSLPIVFKIVD